MTTVVGIDLGTTNTVVARDGKVLAIKQAGGEFPTLPSIVAFTPAGKLVVGRDARKRLAIDPENTVASSKRIIGRDWSSSEIAEYRQRYGAVVVNDQKRGPVFKTRAGNKSPTDIAATLIREALLGAGLVPHATKAVITVPAAFDNTQRAATEIAGRQAGLAEVALLEEPVATAIAHGASKNVRFAAVYDIGGGTFDLCVLDCQLWPVGILAHGGDLFLGGDDFDEAIAADIAHTLLRERNWDMRTNNEAFRRLVDFAEQAKVRLSTEKQVTIDLGEIDPAMPGGPTFVVDRTVLGRACYNLVRRTFATCDRVFEEIAMKPRELERLFLAGGATQMPLVQEWVGHYFGLPPAPDVAPFEVVATGASLAAREAFSS